MFFILKGLLGFEFVLVQYEVILFSIINHFKFNIKLYDKYMHRSCCDVTK